MQHYDDMQPVGRLISLIGSREFGNQFYRVIDDMIGIDQCAVFIFGRMPLRALLAEAHCERTANEVRLLAQSYIDDNPPLETFWERCRQTPDADQETCVFTAREIAQQQPRHRSYVNADIKHELALLTLLDGDYIYAGFYRGSDREDFSADTVDLVRNYSAAIMRVLHKHCEFSPPAKIPDCRPERLSREELLKRVRAAITADCSVLTSRESEICALIALGYSVLAISLNLSISVNTVATHRKRAYAKLRVSSQSELFARYFSVVEDSMSRMYAN